MDEIKKGILQYLGHNNYVSDVTIQLYLYAMYGAKVDREEIEIAVNEMLVSGELIQFVFEYENKTRRRLLFSKGTRLVMETKVARMVEKSDSSL